jgi:hypothetical protein
VHGFGVTKHCHGKEQDIVNSSTRPAVKEDRGFLNSARDAREREIDAVVHALRDQACILGLGISALRYPGDSEQEMQQHLAALEDVVEDMSREFQRLDRWLLQAGYKQKLSESSPVGRARRIKGTAARV